MTGRQAVHQWVAGASTGDAISSYALALQEMLRRWGFESDLFADFRHVSFDMRRNCRDVRSFPERPAEGTAVIYHFSVGSEVSERFLALPAGVTRILCYHNITPARYFRSLRRETAAVLEEGRRQLLQLAPAADLGLGVSAYNCGELREAGCANTAVVPLIWQRPDVSLPPDGGVLAAHDPRSVSWLFVGRVAPNKKLEDVIRAFYWYRKAVRKASRLFLVGSTAGMERYVSSLRALTVQLDLPDVHFAGHVTASQLVAYYRLARVFVCMSEHEGFCLPLLEAMAFDVPVLAYAAAAVPETVGSGGILFHRKDYRLVAELADLAAADGESREALVAAGRRRLDDFSSAKVESALRSALEPWLGTPA